MRRTLDWLLPLVLLAACGDVKVDDSSTLPTAPPPGSTTTNGTVAANISGEQFLGRLSSAASVVESRLVFTAYDGYNRQLAFSVTASGPGTFESGGSYNPVVSLIESFGDETRRWISPSIAGFGAMTLTFLTEDKAIGHFSFAMLPDSATIAAGFTTRRSATAGTFDINISR